MYFIAVWIPRYICGQCHNGMLLRATIEYVALAGLHQYMLFMELHVVCARGSTTKCLGKLCLSIGVCEDQELW